jgi:hypothetical protein
MGLGSIVEAGFSRSTARSGCSSWRGLLRNFVKSRLLARVITGAQPELDRIRQLHWPNCLNHPTRLPEPTGSDSKGDSHPVGKSVYTNAPHRFPDDQ